MHLTNVTLSVKVCVCMWCVCVVCVNGWHLVAALQQKSSGGQLVNSVEVKSTRRSMIWGFWDFLETPNEKRSDRLY